MIMGFFDKLSQVGKTVGTQLTRRARKELGGYKSLERAQNELEMQKTTPKRAPLNVPKQDFTKQKLQDAQKVLEQMRQKNEQLVTNMNQIKIVSRDPAGASILSEDQHSHDIPEDAKKKLPQQRFSSLSSDPLELPRGLAQLSDVVDIMHNHALDPVQWSPSVIAEKFNLRESDVESLIKYFSLLKQGEASTEPSDLEKSL